ncbi:phosphatase PAP2 family protein [Ulvibacter antarcticus]|uniref:PAP2 superfamily protein n=1 Tax=Ulvibacter antarcticus TaxID=442714 RepID=A0A3L9YVD7_9FLAO|nr:phosphatase PAP2 family protein [Ulvibacter antarcticus]RMA64483.1 PAP2 superfamily protein [Ulvibacter antarcticus]
MKKLTLALAILLSYSSINAQSSVSPYEWDWVKDGIWLGASLGATAYGFTLIQNKDDLGTDASALPNKEDISGINRWAAGKHDEDASKLSDIPFALAFATPFIMLFDDEANDHTGKIAGMYIESLATTAGLFTIAAGLVDKSRPYVYDESGDTDLGRRLKNNGQRSFYSGHVAATATATFFAVKVYSDFNPDSPATPYLWAGAAVLPATVGYLRIEAGQHFLTDVLIGYVLGSATGYFVPELHKTKGAKLDVYPSSGMSFTGENYSGMALRYTF